MGHMHLHEAYSVGCSQAQFHSRNAVEASQKAGIANVSYVLNKPFCQRDFVYSTQQPMQQE